MAGWHSGAGQVAEARQCYAQLLALLPRQIELHPADPRFPRTLAAAYQNLAVLHSAQGEKDEALACCERATSCWKSW